MLRDKKKGSGPSDPVILLPTGRSRVVSIRVIKTLGLKINRYATTSSTGSGLERQVGDDDEDYQERKPCHPHQARVGDMSRTLRFEAGNGDNDGDDHNKTEPS
jgi:hypothetical protein